MKRTSSRAATVLFIAVVLGGEVQAAPDAVWGPLEAGTCVGDGLRQYRATLRNAGSEFAERCTTTFHNVMGARFIAPVACVNGVGAWHVRDHTCDTTPPTPPPRGADGGVDREMEGYADLHNHLFAHVAFGGTVLWGELWGAPEDVLRPMAGPHQRAHRLITGFFGSQGLWGGLTHRHDERGWPEFTGWPRHDIATHQQTYVDWLFRAYRGGHRLILAPAVNNQDMFGRGENPLGDTLTGVMRLIGASATPLEGRTSNDMEAVEHQIRAAHEFEAAVARKWGESWLVVAETPDEAEAAIEAGRMAIVLGVEVDHVFNCDLGRHCDEARITEGLDKLDALGVAAIFPTHHKLTQIGGAASFHPLSTGPVEDCFYSTRPCSSVGLRPLGRHLVRGMMQRGMLVDLGHGGAKPFDETIELLEAEDYPVLMSHAEAQPLHPEGTSEYTLTWSQLRRIRALGGMISVHPVAGEYAQADNSGATIPLSCVEGGGGFAQGYLYARDAMDGALDADGGKVALAVDWNGFAGLPAPRSGCTPRGRLVPAPPMQYPFALPAKLKPAAVGATRELPMFEWPEGKWHDFNDTGLAHSGMQPDLLEDARVHGLSEADLEPFYRSARGFIETWRRARERRVEGDRGWLRWIPQSPTDLIEFEHLDRTRLVGSGPLVPVCRLRKTGQWGTLVRGACRVVEGEPPVVASEITAGPIRNANSGLCLSAGVQGACTATWTLRASAWHAGRWWLVSDASALCVAVDEDRLVEKPCSEARQQLWQLERIGNTFRLREPESDRCAHVRGRSLEAGQPVQLARCPLPGRADFHWEIDGYRDEVDYELLFSTRAAARSIAWKKRPTRAFPHALVGENGALICRPPATDGALGTAAKGVCRYVDVYGEARTTRSYEQLVATEPLRF